MEWQSMMKTTAMCCYCIHTDGVVWHHSLCLSLSIFKQSVNWVQICLILWWRELCFVDSLQSLDCLFGTDQLWPWVMKYLKIWTVLFSKYVFCLHRNQTFRFSLQEERNFAIISVVSAGRRPQFKERGCWGMLKADTVITPFEYWVYLQVQLLQILPL